MKHVEMTIVEGVNIPWEQLDTWQKKSNQYTCTLIYDGKQFVTPFFTGSGWKDEPTWMDVLGSLICDARAYESSRDFTDFCSDFGYDTFNEKAKEVYYACKRTSEALPQVFGDDLADIADYLIAEGY